MGVIREIRTGKQLTPNHDGDIRASLRASWQRRADDYFTPGRLRAFLAVAEQGGLSAAARRLYVSQPALSQTIRALERHLGLDLFVRTNAGVQLTQAGRTLVEEAHSILACHDHLLQAMAGHTAGAECALRLAIPLFLAPSVLQTIANFASEHRSTRLKPTHSASMADELDDLRSARLDVSFLHERPPAPEFDTMAVAREELGVLLPNEVALKLAGSQGVRLEHLSGMQWCTYPRARSPGWLDELTATLRGYGIEAGVTRSEIHFEVLSQMFTAVSAGDTFALIPRHCVSPLPGTVTWLPIANHSVVQRTWAVWLASSRRRDVAKLIATFEPLEGTEKAKS